MVYFNAFKYAAVALVSCQLAQATSEPKTYYDILNWATTEGDKTKVKLNADMKNKYYGIADGMDGQLNCATNEQIPTPPRSLSFCHKFNDNACCVPQLDDENNDFFGQLTNLGLSCRLRGDIREDALAKLYCMNCDPDQPKYIRVGASIDELKGDNGFEGSYTAANESDAEIRQFRTADFVAEEGKSIVLISLQWAIEEFKADPLLSGRDNRLAKCGLLVSVPCAGDTVTELDGRDRYMCGDDLFLPANSGYGIIQTDDDGAYLVNQSLFQFFNYPSLATPAIDDGFHFFLVDERPCDTKSEVPKLDPSVYINPYCARTAEQIKTVNISELDNKMTYRDWVCANLEGEFDASDFIASTATNEGYCESECDSSLLTGCDGGDDVKCTAYADKLQSSSKARCCCGHWNDELVFSSAHSVTPAIVTLALSFLMAFVTLH